MLCRHQRGRFTRGADGYNTVRLVLDMILKQPLQSLQIHLRIRSDTALHRGDYGNKATRKHITRIPQGDDKYDASNTPPLLAQRHYCV